MTTTSPTLTHPTRSLREATETEATSSSRGSNGRGSAIALPTMASVDSTESVDLDASIRGLRGFHVGAGSDVVAPEPGTLPALLHPYRDVARLRTDYPVYVSVDDGVLVCRPLADQLEAWAEAATVGGRVLTDNLVRVERCMRDALSGDARSHDAREVLASASERVHRDLGLKGDGAETLRAGLDALTQQVADGAVVLGFGEGASLSLAIACARATLPDRRDRFAAVARDLCQKLSSLIAIERTKDPASRDSNAVESSLGGSNLQIDAAALARVIGPHRGSAQADPVRRDRLAASLAALEAYLARVDAAPVITFVCRDGATVAAVSAEDVRVVSDADPCSAALAEFDRTSVEMAAVLRAMRRARLEIDGSYDPVAHEAWIEQLAWDGFSADELRTVTPVFAVEQASRLSGEGLRGLSRLLRSGKPVKVLVDVLPAADPDADAVLGDSVRFEFGYFGISHREALVHQTAEARPAHLVDGLRKALDATRPSVHVLAAPHDIAGDLSEVGGWLHTGAAVDGRAHPLFCYDPEPGVSWARRFEMSGNPEPDAAWPTGVVPYCGTDGAATTMELAFTFADFALLEPSYRARFAVVPAGVPDDVLAPVEEWLRLELDDAATRVPFVWAVEPAGQLLRLAISRELAFACRDRQRYWRTLQEWAGVHNEHVERAVAGALEEAEARHSAERERLEAEAAEEVERVRREAAGEAMQRLAAVLLDADLAALGAGVSAAPGAAPSPAAKPAAVSQEGEPAEEAAPAPAAVGLSFDEAFIDTPLCTTCNDCININPIMFVYDDNKQARISDASAGTFEHLVLAAEKCPARCIHPGKPLDPDEPNLDALVERAAEFN